MSAPNQQSETAQMPSKGSGRTGLYAAIAVVVILVVVLAGLYAAGYIHGPSTGTTKVVGACAPLTILGAGSTFVEQLQFEWASVYTTDSVSYGAVGSGAGISEITAKTIAYGASDAPLNATQAAAAPGLLTMPETAGAVTVIFNLPGVTFKVGQSLNLTGNVLAEIYLGTITTWNAAPIAALNTGVTLPSATIAVFHRSDGSGTSYAFTQFLSDSNATWKSKIGYSTLPDWALTVGSGAKGSSGIAGAVKETPDSISYVDLGEAINAGPLQYAAIENPAGHNIVPSVNNTASAINDLLKTTTLPAGSGNWSGVSMINAPGAQDYPIATFSYMLFYQSAGANRAIGSAAAASAFVHWLNWTITTGQQYSGQLYYIPLPAAVVAADQATLGTMTYNGDAIAACS